MLTRAAVRTFSTEALKVVNDVAKQQFTVAFHGKEAVLEYDKSGKKIIFVHTEVPEIFQGKGVGKILAKSAFDYAVENSLDVTCQCTFVAKFYEKNQQDYGTLNVKIDV